MCGAVAIITGLLLISQVKRSKQSQTGEDNANLQELLKLKSAEVSAQTGRRGDPVEQESKQTAMMFHCHQVTRTAV